MHMLDSASMGRDYHCTGKSTLTMTRVHFAKSNFWEGKVHLNAQFSVEVWNPSTTFLKEIIGPSLPEAQSHSAVPQDMETFSNILKL
jgi:hypothetical protein